MWSNRFPRCLKRKFSEVICSRQPSSAEHENQFLHDVELCVPYFSLDRVHLLLVISLRQSIFHMYSQWRVSRLIFGLIMSACGKFSALAPTGNDGLSRTASRDHSDEQQKSLKDCQNAEHRELCMCLLLRRCQIIVFSPIHLCQTPVLLR